MTLVVSGLLLGLVGLIWVLAINIVQADRQSERQGPPRPDKPVVATARRESKAA